MINIQLTTKEIDILKLVLGGLNPEDLEGADIMILSAVVDKLHLAKPDYHPTKEDIWQALKLACR